MFKKILSNFNKLDFQIKCLIISLPLTLIVIGGLFAISAGELFFASWFITFISVPALLSNQLSFFAHMGRTMDLLRERKLWSDKHTTEFGGRILGILIGLGFGLWILIKEFMVPLSSAIGKLAHFFFTFRQINIFTSLGNRIGRTFDKHSRPLNEKIGIAIIIGFGMYLAANLLVVGATEPVSIIGVTAFLIGATTVPNFVAAIIFFLTVTSVFAAAADYGAKGANYIYHFFTKDQDLIDRVKRCKYDYLGSLIGTVGGAVIGAICATAILVSSPQLLAGFVGAVTFGLIIVSTAAIFGAIVSQCGAILDAILKVRDDNKKEAEKTISHLKITPIAANNEKMVAAPNPAPTNQNMLPIPSVSSNKQSLFQRARQKITKLTGCGLLPPENSITMTKIERSNMCPSQRH